MMRHHPRWWDDDMEDGTMRTLEAWRQDQRRRGLLDSTIQKRTVNLHAFARWMHPRPLASAGVEDVQAFLDSREPITARTRYDWLATLHSYFGWAVKCGLTNQDPTELIDRPRTRDGIPRPISEPDLAVAIGCADPTMRAWLVLGAYAGLRCAEIAGLNRDQILDHLDLLRVLGKGRRERLVPIHPAVWQALHAHGLPRTGPVFIHTGRQVTPVRVSRQISRFLHGLGIDATAHQLRHRFATCAYRQCRDLRVVQELLGHSSPTTTAIYTAFDGAASRAAVLSIR